MVKELIAGAISAAVCGTGGSVPAEMQPAGGYQTAQDGKYVLADVAFTGRFQSGAGSDKRDVILIDDSYSWEEVRGLGTITLEADISDIVSSSRTETDFGAMLYTVSGTERTWYAPAEAQQSFDGSGKLTLTLDAQELEPSGSGSFCCMGAEFFISSPENATEASAASTAAISFRVYTENEPGTTEWLTRLRTEFPDFAALYQEEKSFPLPGTGSADCGFMVPQGLCSAGNYFLVSAYCSGCSEIPYSASGYDPDEHRGEHSSVVYVIDKTTGSHLCTLVTRDANHVGGLCYDPDSKLLWIAKSTDQQLDAVPYSVIERAAEAGGTVTLDDSSYAAKGVDCGMTASYLTFDSKNGLIWVGSWSSEGAKQNIIRGFRLVSRDGSLSLKAHTKPVSLSTNSSNGMSFISFEGRTFLAVSSSLTRRDRSELQLYSVAFDRTDSKLLDVKLQKLGRSISSPNMLEELCCTDDLLYMNFESAAQQFYNYSDPSRNSAEAFPTPKVCAIDLRDYLSDLNNIALAQTELDYQSYTFSGSPVRIDKYLTVSDGGRTLVNGRDYMTSYKNNNEVGYNTASVTITGIGSYTGSVTRTFTIKPAKQPAPKLTTEDGDITVTWDEDSSAVGYQIIYSKDKDLTKDVHTATVTGRNTLFIRTQVSAGETWYVKVRSFITDTGEPDGTRFGTYSKVSRIKVK